MRLQVAIDRVSLDEAIKLAEQFEGQTDILEMGTSLVKDYGNLAIEKLREVLPTTELLIDSKTIDEGAYEFNQAIKYGGDIVTVMGAASVATLNACYEVVQQQNKTMMIDLLEVSDDKIARISHFPEAIYMLHHSIDRNDSFNATESINEFNAKFPEIHYLAIAGGIDLEQTKDLANQNQVEIIIVGSSITKAEEPLVAVKEFMEVIHK